VLLPWTVDLVLRQELPLLCWPIWSGWDAASGGGHGGADLLKTRHRGHAIGFCSLEPIQSLGAAL